MPFTAAQFFEIFEKYNQFVYPMQIVLTLLATAPVVAAAARHNKTADRLISGVLALLWLWAGIVYHLTFFTRINRAAYLFGALFILQGSLFLYQGIIKKRLRFRLKNDFRDILGAVFIFYALLLYPLAGSLLSHVFPLTPTFGAPCPIVIYTFGLLMWTDQRLPVHLAAIPFLWAGISSLAAAEFGVYEDFGLLCAACVGTFFIVRRFFATEREVFL